MDQDFEISVIAITKTSTPFGRTNDDGTGGDTIRNLISENWDKYEKINILFDGIAQMTRGFIDEAFSKVLEDHPLEEFNNKIYFPDAKESIVKALNESLKLRMKIIKSKKEKEQDAL